MREIFNSDLKQYREQVERSAETPENISLQIQVFECLFGKNFGDFPFLEPPTLLAPEIDFAKEIDNRFADRSHERIHKSIALSYRDLLVSRAKFLLSSERERGIDYAARLFRFIHAVEEEKTAGLMEIKQTVYWFNFISTTNERLARSRKVKQFLEKYRSTS